MRMSANWMSAAVLLGAIAAGAQTAPSTPKPATGASATATAPHPGSSTSSASDSSSEGKNSLPIVPVAERATEADVRKMFEAMKVHETNERFMHGIEPLLARQAAQATAGFPNLDDSDRKFIQQVQQEEVAKMTAPDFVNQIVDASIPAYMQHLTAADVKQVTAFYSSPAGQHLEAVLPDVSREAMQTAMPLIQQHAREVTSEQQKRLTDYMTKKYGTTVPKPAGSGGTGIGSPSSSSPSSSSPSTASPSGSSPAAPSASPSAPAAGTSPANSKPSTSSPEGPKQ